VTQYHIPEDLSPQILLVLSVPVGTVRVNIKKKKKTLAIQGKTLLPFNL